MRFGKLSTPIDVFLARVTRPHRSQHTSSSSSCLRPHTASLNHIGSYHNHRSTSHILIVAKHCFRLFGPCCCCSPICSCHACSNAVEVVVMPRHCPEDTLHSSNNGFNSKQSSWQNNSSSCQGGRHGSKAQQMFRSCSAMKRLLCWVLTATALQLLCGHALAAGTGPPCVACDDCVTSSCLRVCVPSCKTGPTMAEGSAMSTDQCQHKGQEAALDIATAACKLSQVRAADVLLSCGSAWQALLT